MMESSHSMYFSGLFRLTSAFEAHLCCLCVLSVLSSSYFVLRSIEYWFTCFPVDGCVSHFWFLVTMNTASVNIDGQVFVEMHILFSKVYTREPTASSQDTQGI